MGWTKRILGGLFLIALAAQPSYAVSVDMPIVDRQGNPIIGFTIVSNWPDGKVTKILTTPFGRAVGPVPEGWHFCSIWFEGGHMESGWCNFTTDVRPLFSRRSLRGHPKLRALLEPRNWYPAMRRPGVLLVNSREEAIEKLINQGFTREAAEKLAGYIGEGQEEAPAGSPQGSPGGVDPDPSKGAPIDMDQVLRESFNRSLRARGFGREPAARDILIAKWGQFGVALADLFGGLEESAGGSGDGGDGSD